MKYGILADDFTGAGDVSLQFRRGGFKVAIVTKLGASIAVKGADVVVLDTETRNSSSEDAYKTVRKAVEVMKESRVELVYKKIDSTLRGNIGSELDAVLDATFKKFSLVAPALPEAQRATVGGYHLVRWVPIEQTEFANDPIKPVKESNLVKLISLQSKRAVAHVPLTRVVKGLSALKREVANRLKEGAEIIVVDAVTKGDLRAIAQVCKIFEALPCGSSGLAGEVAELLGRSKGRAVIAFSSSVNPIFIEQVAEAAKEPKVSIIELDASKLLNESLKESELGAIKRRISEAISQNRDVIVKLKGVRGHLPFGSRELIKKAMGRLAVEAMKSGKVKSLVLVGGDTAFSVAESLGASMLSVEGEAELGAPILRVIGGKREGIKLITRPGGFGDKGSLVRLMKRLKGEVD